MANLTKHEFNPLERSGNNYLTWKMDIEIHLESMGLEKTIKRENMATSQDRAKSMIFLRHHLDEGLKLEYLTVRDPCDLWESLKRRYDHLKMINLPNARHEWQNLRLQDYKTVNDYNSAMFRITSQLKLCGEKITEGDMLGKNIFNLSCLKSIAAATV